MQVETVFDEWLPILVWGSLLLWFLVKRRFFAALGTTLVFLGLFIEPWPLSQIWGFIFLTAAVWLEILADGGAYGRWRRRGEEQV